MGMLHSYVRVYDSNKIFGIEKKLHHDSVSTISMGIGSTMGMRSIMGIGSTIGLELLRSVTKIYSRSTELQIT